MSAEPFFFVPDERAGRMEMGDSSHGMIQHEVFYEERTNTIRERPLFLGRSYRKKRFLFAFSILAFVLVGFIGRAAWMQVIEQNHYQGLAENNRLRHTPLWPRRGLIEDRRGVVLADNVSRFQVTLTPRDLPRNKQQLQLELGEATRLLGMSIEDVQPLINSTSTPFEEESVIANHLSYADAMAFAIALPHLPGFDLQVGAERRYPLSKELTSLSHVLGYTGKLSPEEYLTRRGKGYHRSNEIGKTGVERSYEKVLRGTAGERLNEVDAHGQLKALVGNKPAIDGEDIHLTLDLELQRTAEVALRAEMEVTKVYRGAVIAMDPRDGSVLTLVSLPAFDNNDFSGGVSSTVYQGLIQNPDQPLYPRAWAGVYPSGSTAKIVISVAALAEKVINPHTSVVSVGGIQVGPWFFPDWKAGGHGVTDVRKGIAWSVNTFFYTIGGGYESFVGLGVDRLHDWMQRFGLGSKTGIDLPTEGTGFVPSKDWKQETKGERWFVGDTYNLSIGQGDLLVTPLQVADYTAAIANGGKRPVPHVVAGVGDQIVTSTLVTIPGINRADVETVRLGMRDCVKYGSCRSLSALSFPTAAKTGTAQWNTNKQTHAWFTSFAPFDDPEVVVTVLLEEGGEGSSTAAPVAKQVFQKWWELRSQRGGEF